MTNREFYTAIINNTITAEVIDFATAEIGKLDARNEKRRNTPTKAQEANVGIKEAIKGYLASVKSAVASEIATAVGVSTQKVSALCKQLVDNGEIKVADVKVRGKGTLKAYSLAE